MPYSCAYLFDDRVVLQSEPLGIRPFGRLCITSDSLGTILEDIVTQFMVGNITDVDHCILRVIVTDAHSCDSTNDEWEVSAKQTNKHITAMYAVDEIRMVRRAYVAFFCHEDGRRHNRFIIPDK